MKKPSIKHCECDRPFGKYHYKVIYDYMWSEYSTWSQCLEWLIEVMNEDSVWIEQYYNTPTTY